MSAFNYYYTMITPNKNGKAFVKCAKCHALVKPANNEADTKLLNEGAAEYYCDDCSSIVSEDDGDSCLLCQYGFVKDEIRYTFQMHSTVNVKKLYKEKELSAVGNICERCRGLVEKIVVFNNH